MPTRLVERHQASSRWAGLVRLAEEGSGRVAVLIGEAGIGKTRLLAEVVGSTTVRGWVARTAETREIDETRAFGSVADSLDVSPTATDPRPSEIARLLHRRESWTQSLEQVPVEVHHVSDVLIGLAGTLCSSASLVHVVVNLHWADCSTLVFLRRLVQLCPQCPVLLLMSTRPTDRPEVETLVRLVADSGGTRVDLEPLRAAHQGGCAAEDSPPRHTAASLMLAAEVQPKVVQEMLGHADVRITLGICGHVTPSMGREAGAALSASLLS